MLITCKFKLFIEGIIESISLTCKKRGLNGSWNTLWRSAFRPNESWRMPRYANNDVRILVILRVILTHEKLHLLASFTMFMIILPAILMQYFSTFISNSAMFLIINEPPKCLQLTLTRIYMNWLKTSFRICCSTLSLNTTGLKLRVKYWYPRRQSARFAPFSIYINDLDSVPMTALFVGKALIQPI